MSGVFKHRTPPQACSVFLNTGLRLRAVSATLVDKLALLGACAHASTIARETRAAALRLALVVLEHEQIVGTDLELGEIAIHRLVGLRVAPVAHRVASGQAHTIVGADGLVGRLSTARVATVVCVALVAVAVDVKGTVVDRGAIIQVAIGCVAIGCVAIRIVRKALTGSTEYGRRIRHHQYIRQDQQKKSTDQKGRAAHHF